MSKSNQQPIYVIGAGIGGLSAAIRLAVAGQQVVVLEKNSQPGGKMGQVEQDGFRWDTGPSVITMRHVFEDLFNAAGKELEDYIQLQPIEPLTRYFYRNGTIIDASTNAARMKQEIERLNPGDVKGYTDYLAYAERIHRITGPVFIYDHPPTPLRFARVPPNEWLKVDPFRTMHESIKGYVKSPELRQLLGRFATYVGGSPYEAPATLNVIAHVELNEGVWYPKGGIYEIATGLTQLVEELGVEIRTDCPVTKINTTKNRIAGVSLKNGDTIAARVVVSNVDVTTTYRNLLPQNRRAQKRLQKLKAFEPSCSGFILLLGIDGTFDQLAHHNIFFSDDYEAEFKAIFKQQQPADDPTIYVAITSKADSDHAPPGCENWFVLVNAPATSNNVDWQLLKTQYRELVLTKLADAGFDVRGKIRTETILTPVELQEMTGAWRGALYGPSSNSRWTAFRRPHNRSEEVKGLYFAGGTTHPGGGVPMVTLSGKVAAEMVIEDLS